jgi:hypothetical protein
MLNSSAENSREARYAFSLGDHHRFCRRYYRARAGAWTKQSRRFHSHDAIAGAFVATFTGQAIGWYRADQGAGLIGAVVG